MNPQSDLKRSMFLIKILFALIGIVFSCLFLISFSPDFYQIFLSKISVLLLFSCLIIFLILSFNLLKNIKRIDTAAQDMEKALVTSESKYKSMVENIQIGFARSTPGSQGEYIEVNTYFAKMLGYSKEELIKMPVAELYKDNHKRKQFSDRISQMGLVKDEELLFCKKNGDVITISVTGIAVRDDNGQVAFFDLIIDDVTRKKFNNEEAIKNEKLTSIGILAGGIAHDFNNILTGLYGNIALAKLELEPDSEAAQLIHDAELSMTKATDLTQQLLVFAKGGDPIKETIPLEQTIKEAAKFNLSGSNVKLETRFDSNLWHVHADKAQISQVISNLVINARHAMPDGGILTITAENIEINTNDIASLSAGNYVKIMVEDDGIGIPQDCISQIFDPYFTTKHTGSGMGLATCFSIIKKHSGWITASSDPGQGAAFQIFLPAEDVVHTPEKWDDDDILSDKETANILIMDDDEQVCVITQKMITLFGYRSHVVHDGTQAIAAYRQAIKSGNPYDLVLMDLTIPGGMGGKEAIVKILDIHPDAKAVVISGYSNDLVLANYRDYGFKGMLVKPFKMQKLKETLDKILK